ncbi:MAG: hypothetical protein NY202_02585 [Mollicutes bacterium UO1]
MKTNLNTTQTDLSNEKLARQQAESERDQRPNITLEEYDKLQNNQKPDGLPAN